MTLSDSLRLIKQLPVVKKCSFLTQEKFYIFSEHFIHGFFSHFSDSSEKEINKMDVQTDSGQQVTRHIFPKQGSDKGNASPALGQLPNYGDDAMDLNSQVIKVYRGDHTSRFFVLTKVGFSTWLDRIY